jgi:Cytochrome P460
MPLAISGRKSCCDFGMATRRHRTTTRHHLSQKRRGKIMIRWNRYGVIAGVACLAGAAGLTFALAAPPGGTTAAVEFTPDGKLKKPDGYRNWVYVGAVVTPNDLNDGEAAFPEFHSVYMDPESFAHYEKTGEFRDGTVMIKELIGVGAKEATSGKGYFMGDFRGLEASIKDSKRFKDEPGSWAYFSFGHKYPLKAEATKQAAASCNACHQTNAAKDDVFSQYYPVLRAAAPRSE